MGSILHIVRGLPGSGKTTFAKTLGCAHFEADMYFMRNGAYQFDGSVIRQAHNWCQASVRECVDREMDVVVSNTFTTLKEMQFYLDLGCGFKVDIKVHRCAVIYGSIHDVPEASITKMKNRFQDYKGEIYVNNGHTQGSSGD